MKIELVDKLNAYISDIGVFYIKLHNLHWNLKGSQFKAVHEYFESLYEAFADVLDEVAELLRMKGYIPAASMKEYLTMATIEELDGSIIDVKTALEIVHDDMKILKGKAKEIRELADSDGDFATVNMMEENISDYAKNIWFLRSMVA